MNSALIAVLHFTVTETFPILFTSIDKHFIWSYLLFWCYLVYSILFSRCGLSTRKQNMGEAII